MSKRVYACLLGEWINLSICPNVLIDNKYENPNLWFEEVGHKMFEYDYIDIKYQDFNYRIHPSFIQVLTRD